MVALMKHARLIGFIKKEHGNPAKGIPLFKQESEGWLPWPDDVRAEFENLAPPRARLVYELCIGTGQRIGDIVKMRWFQIKDGRYDLTQGKGDDKGRPVRYEVVATAMRDLKSAMKHPDAKTYVTHGLRRNATIELYQADCDDEMVTIGTGGHIARTLIYDEMTDLGEFGVLYAKTVNYHRSKRIPRKYRSQTAVLKSIANAQSAMIASNDCDDIGDLL